MSIVRERLEKYQVSLEKNKNAVYVLQGKKENIRRAFSAYVIHSEIESNLIDKFLKVRNSSLMFSIEETIISSVLAENANISDFNLQNLLDHITILLLGQNEDFLLQEKKMPEMSESSRRIDEKIIQVIERKKS